MRAPLKTCISGSVVLPDSVRAPLKTCISGSVVLPDSVRVAWQVVCVDADGWGGVFLRTRVTMLHRLEFAHGISSGPTNEAFALT